MGALEALGTSDLEMALRRCMKFAKMSISMHGGRGSSHSYSFWLNPDQGWQKPYPETTGYLLMTLRRAAEYLEDEEALRAVDTCLQWLIEVQDDRGFYPTGVNPGGRPSVFNTAIVVQGLLPFLEDREEVGRVVERGYSWLMSVQEGDGAFLKYAYVERFFPTYYTRVAWSMLEGGRVMSTPSLFEGGERCLERLLGRFEEDQIRDCGFRPGGRADLHTVAYALRGLSESLRLLQRENKQVDGWLDYFASLWVERGRWPGRLFPHVYNFESPTGMAQILLCFFTRGISEDWMMQVVRRLMRMQRTSGPAEGGLPGSVPFYGRYMPLAYPNWAVKFFMDVLLELLDQKDKSRY